MRRFVEGHVDQEAFSAFPVPDIELDEGIGQRVVELAGRLAATDDRFQEWAEAVGVDCGPVGDDEREAMIYELDAVVAHLYGLKQEHLKHIFETFHEGWDYEPRLRGVLKRFRAWNQKA